MSQEIIEIDGGMMEGGGQILRMSLALSALLRKPVRICNIRAGRSSPGLRPQHLAGVQLVREITRGQLTGGVVGSTQISFHPGNIRGGSYSADPGTAGSVVLLFQVSFPLLLFADAPTELHLRGGTNADMAPQIDHTLMVFKPIVQRLGAKFSCEVLKRGYYPKGGGAVLFRVPPLPRSLQPIELLQAGQITDVQGRAYVAGVLPIKVAHGMADSASRLLQGALPSRRMQLQRLKETAAEGNGAGIVLVGKTESGCLIGGSALGKRGVPSEEVGERAAKEILDVASIGACVDSYVQDQLIIFLALAEGKSRVRIGAPTLHTRTAIRVAETMTEATFTISPDETQKSYILECEGIGLKKQK